MFKLTGAQNEMFTWMVNILGFAEQNTYLSARLLKLFRFATDLKKVFLSDSLMDGSF